jgi:hypothetical protein
MAWLPFARVLAFGGAALVMAALPVSAQTIPSRMRGRPPYEPQVPPAAQAAPAAQPAMPLSKEPFVSAPLTATPTPSLLQQPANEAQISFADQRLSIHAENASLTAILHEIATRSGMHITGLASDERVFGTFGPGSPRDVLDDLMNGTAYNLMLLGDQANGAPRELILTQATRTGGTTVAPVNAAAGDQANPADDSAGDQEPQDAAQQPPPDVPPPPPTSPGSPGVRTPQQLFEQLQQMRQAQQQGLNPGQEQQPAQPPVPAAQQQQ